MSDFLYPFLDASETDSDTLLVDLARSAREKSEISHALQEKSLESLDSTIEAASLAMAQRFAAGGRLYTFGNGGSSTDAATLAWLFCNPPHGRPLPAMSLTADQAVVTALGNDVGFELIFSRQLIALAKPTDIAIAVSTSGSSEDLIHGMAQARRLGLLTLAFAGYDGGQLARSDDVAHCLVVDSQSVHRIQESQAVIGYRLWQVVQSHVELQRSKPTADRSAGRSREVGP